MGSEASSPLELSVPVWFNLGERRMESQGLGKERKKQGSPFSVLQSFSVLGCGTNSIQHPLRRPLVIPMGDLPATCCRWSQVGETGYASALASRDGGASPRCSRWDQRPC